MLSVDEGYWFVKDLNSKNGVEFADEPEFVDFDPAEFQQLGKMPPAIPEIEDVPVEEEIAGKIRLSAALQSLLPFFGLYLWAISITVICIGSCRSPFFSAAFPAARILSLQDMLHKVKQKV